MITEIIGIQKKFITVQNELGKELGYRIQILFYEVDRAEPIKIRLLIISWTKNETEFLPKNCNRAIVKDEWLLLDFLKQVSVQNLISLVRNEIINGNYDN